MKAVVEIPDEQASAFEPYREHLGELLLLGLSQMKIQESLLLYQRGLVSLARAAEMAAVSQPEMMRHARAAGIAPPWSAPMVAEELA